MERIGHRVRILDPESMVPRGGLLGRFHYETGGVLAHKGVTRKVLAQVGSEPFDLVWVDNVRYVSRELVETLRARFGKAINYNNDDPYGTRDRYSWVLHRKSVPAYDLVLVLREVNVGEACALGAKSVRRVAFTCDEVANAPIELTEAERTKSASEVLFVGTYMPERGPFMKELVDRGVPLTIVGNRWEKAAEWPAIRSAWRAPGTKNYREYASLIQSTKVCLGLLSKGNRDLHTRRSIEIPYLGSLFCAERTQEHLDLYREGIEAVYWDDAAECADVCLRLLANDRERAEIAAKGRERCLQNGNFNEPLVRSAIDQVMNA